MKRIMNMIEIDNLTRSYGKIMAVDNLNLDVGEGEIFGLLGPNGAGKSTVIKMLTTLLPPTSGKAVINGCDVATQPTRVRASIGYVPQLLSVDGALTGHENAIIFAKLYDVPRAEVKKRAAEALEFAGLTSEAGRQVSSYSGGMIRRLEIAMAMIHRPRVLFLDEPTVGLDPIARHDVWTQIRKLSGEYDMTVLFSTHFMDEADELCGRVAIMNLGKLAAVGSPEKLKTALGRKDATLDEVFAHYTGSNLGNGYERNNGSISKTSGELARLG